MRSRTPFILMLALLVVSAAIVQYLAYARGQERVPARRPLAELPLNISGWKMVDEQQLTARELQQLNPDDYLSRTYRGDDGAVAYLFIAFYASQRQRQTFHSPQNCLPGAGWSMRDHKLHTLADGAINEYTIEKDGARMAAFYWYAGRGRTEASEYMGRWHTISDAIWKGRTDGALVRVIVPASKDGAGVVTARLLGLEFAHALTPLLQGFIPQ